MRAIVSVSRAKSDALSNLCPIFVIRWRGHTIELIFARSPAGSIPSRDDHDAPDRARKTVVDALPELYS